jgi:hypothetical protein
MVENLNLSNLSEEQIATIVKMIVKRLEINISHKINQNGGEYDYYNDDVNKYTDTYLAKLYNGLNKN